jgi:hypothetical protein
VPCLNDSNIPDVVVAPEVPTVSKLGGGGIGGFTEGMSTSARSGQCGSQFNSSDALDDDQEADIESGRGSLRESVGSRHGDMLVGIAAEGPDARPISLSANRHDIVRSSTPVERKTLHQRATDMLGVSKPAATSKPSLSVREMLALPGEVLQELSSLLAFLRANDVTAYKANDSCRDARGNCVDFITLKELLCLDMGALGLLSELDDNSDPSEAESSTHSWVAVSQKTNMEYGAWVSQHRIRNAILGTTAFQDICRKVERLQTIDLDELERKQHLPPAQSVNTRMISNDEKLVFCVNLYNLLSLHASIMLPWPAAAQSSVRASVSTSACSALMGALVPTQACAMQRVLWQVHAKYRVGKQNLSLFQLEHGILRSLTPHNVYIAALINNNATSVVGSWLPSVMANLEIAYPSIADVKAFAPLIPNLYQNTVSLSEGGASGGLGMGNGDPRVPFMLRLPHHTSIGWGNVTAQGSRGKQRNMNTSHGVLTTGNLNAALRQMVTLYISQHVRFTSSLQDGVTGTGRAIVLPLLLHKYAGDFAKWKVVYDTPFSLLSTTQTAAAAKAPKSPSRPVGPGASSSLQSAASSLSRSQKGSKPLSTSNTQWDVVEFQQRTSAGNSVGKSSGVDEAPYSGLSAHRPISVEHAASCGDMDAALTEGLEQGCGLWAERELFRICRLLANQLEIKDRKYILKVYKEAFLGRCVCCALLCCEVI